MVLTDILTLVKAGYTRDEIAQMEQQETSNANPEPVPTPVPEPEPKPEPTNVQAPVAEPVAVPVSQPKPVYTPYQIPTETQTEPTMAEIMQSIAKLTSAVQANAIAQSVIPGGLTQQTPTAEDMLAEIIRPTYKAREER